MSKTNEARRIIIEAEDDSFGAVLNCAVRYCIGRQTYMPGLVIDRITPWLPLLSNRTLWCIDSDIEQADSLGDPDVDSPRWRKFQSDVQKEIERRKNEQND